ncbi:MAG TPA: hypothetical protein VL947_10840, partial [Cytophagales bacterium]|nr:hypothetical protein [Cytophagales bacterium]
AVIRVFDRYGERTRRNKARLKYLINDIGFEEFSKLVAQETTALKSKTYKVDVNAVAAPKIPAVLDLPAAAPADAAKYEAWLKTNVFEQKQAGYYGVYVKVTIGDLKSDRARSFAQAVAKYCADDMRVTVNQGYLLKFVPKAHLVHLFNELNTIKLAEPGFDSTADVVACPGTDTCNLGIASSYGLAEELEKVMLEEYPDIIYNNDIKIKISGCMNACGQHTVANIGFHGMSLKHGELVLPGMQVLLGGGIKGDGQGAIADKVIKLPAKRVPQALRDLLQDFEKNGNEGEYFNDYFARQGKNYFYTLLKPLGVIGELTQDLLVDWGNTENYETAVGVGECAGVLVDMVQILLNEQQDKLNRADEYMAEGNYADAIYLAYTTFINSAKALLLSRDIQCNTQHGIMNDFDKNFVETGEVAFREGGFRATVLLLNQNEPTAEFATFFKKEADTFLRTVNEIRNKQVANA